MKLNKKKITILICLFFFLLVYFLLSSLIFAKNEGLAKLVRDNTPFAIKNFFWNGNGSTGPLDCVCGSRNEG